MSMYSADLCTFLVNDLYGGLAGQVFGDLCSLGRATLSEIRERTRLSARELKHALAVLIQQGLVSWYIPSSEQPAAYEANLATADNLLRNGKYPQLAESRFGTLAKDMLSATLMLGKATIREVVEACCQEATNAAVIRAASTQPLSSKIQPSDTESFLRQDQEDVGKARREAHRVLGNLLEDGLLSFVHISDCRTADDNQVELQKLVPEVARYKGKTQSQRAAIRETELNKKCAEWRFGTWRRLDEIHAFKTGRDRTLDDVNQSGSRKRLKIGTRDQSSAINQISGPNAAVEPHDSTLDDTTIRSSRDKFAALMRNETLANLAEQQISPVTAKVYRQVLRMLEYRTRACRDNEEGELGPIDYASTLRVSTRNVRKSFPDESELLDALGKVDEDMSFLHHPKKRRRKNDGLSASADHYSDDEDTDEPESRALHGRNSNNTGPSEETVHISNGDLEPEELMMAPFRQHLLLLANHSFPFIDHHPSANVFAEEWSVNYSRLMPMVACHTMFKTIQSRFDTQSSRIARICFEKGRLDDKALCTLSLLTSKDLRSRLLKLQRAGLLEQQEVPRDNARVASRTTFLYYFDKRKCTARLLEDCHKTILRCLQRLDIEKEKIVGVLEKLERSDVKGREADFLGDREKEGLKKWRQVEEQTWGEVARIDEVVAILRDFEPTQA